MQMTADEQLTDALDMLATAKSAYKKALATPQYVQSNLRRIQMFDIDKMQAAVAYWQKEVDRLNAIVNGVSRPGINSPLRVCL